MKKHIGVLIGSLVLVGLVIWIIFYTVNNRNDKSVFNDGKNTSTEAQILIAKDIDRFYPSTVREVVRLYQRINVCLMTGKYSEEEFYRLVDMLRLLYDDELLEINPRDRYANKLYDEITLFKETGKSIPVTNIQLESQAERYTKDGKNMASIVALFIVKGGNGLEKTYEKFVLREDENGRWKIVGWELTEPVEFPEL